MKEIVTIKTIAYRLGYSEKYFRNKWPQLLCGIRPLKLGPGRSIRFCWQDIEKHLTQGGTL